MVSPLYISGEWIADVHAIYHGDKTFRKSEIHQNLKICGSFPQTLWCCGELALPFTCGCRTGCVPLPGCGFARCLAVVLCKRFCVYVLWDPYALDHLTTGWYLLHLENFAMRTL